MNLDIAFVCRFLKEKEYSAIKAARVDPEMLFDKSKEAVHFIQTFYLAHGSMPTKDTVENECQMILDEDTPEPLSYYAELVRKRCVGNKIGDGVKKALESLDSKDTKGAVDVLQEAIAKAKEIDSVERRWKVDLRTNTKERFDEYERVKRLGGKIDGKPFPWPVLNKATGGIKAGELWFFIASLKIGKCVVGDTPVVDPVTGRIVTMREVVEKKLCVNTLKGAVIDRERPTKYWKNGKKVCVRLVTRNGEVLVATPNHPMLTVDGWKELKDLTVGEKIAGVGKLPTPLTTIDMPNHEIDLLAGMVAEGGSTGHRVSFTNCDKEITDRVRYGVEKMGCRLDSVKGKAGQWDIKWGEQWHHDRSPIRKFMEKHGIFGVLSKNKGIPDAVFSLPSFSLARFIGMLWSCDGSIHRKLGEMTYGCASEKLIDQLRVLLLRFGIVSSKRHKFSGVKGKVFDSWEIRVKGQCKERFVSSIQLVGEKVSRLKEALPEYSKPNNDSVRVTSKLREILYDAVAKKGTWSDFWGHYGWRKEGHDSAGYRGLVSAATGLIPRVRLKAFVEWSGDKRLEWIVSDDVVWDEVKSISSAGKREVFDVTVEDTHNFVASNLIVHNSWSQVVLGQHFWSLGEKMLMVSMEMPIEKIQRRIDAVYAKLPYQEFKEGKLSQDFEIKYAESLLAFKDEKATPFWLAGNGGVRTALDVEELMEDLKPTVVLIDGVYLMGVPGNKPMSKWERVSTVIDSLQQLTLRRGIPIIATSQFTRKVRKGKLEAEAGDVGFAYEIPQAADGLVGLFQDDDLRRERRMLLKLLECREGESVDVMVKWDFSSMSFDEVGIVKAGELKKENSRDERIEY